MDPDVYRSEPFTKQFEEELVLQCVEKLLMIDRKIANGQLESYIKRTIETFTAVWAEEAKYYVHPATLLASGHKAIRERHIE